ncbi:hypothetical protein GGR51DRAFT_540834 [Nemania sp. FL0031]|nr:hypothetical protein GGR51DRAFT_540834 [Nemania sp. FL0031]
MPLSIESVIAIIALFVAVPPTIAILARFYYRYRSNHVTVTPAASQDNLELGVISQDPSAQQQSLSRRTTLIRLLFEDSGQREVFEITRGRPVEDLNTSEANMPLLENT